MNNIMQTIINKYNKLRHEEEEIYKKRDTRDPNPI